MLNRGEFRVEGSFCMRGERAVRQRRGVYSRKEHVLQRAQNKGEWRIRFTRGLFRKFGGLRIFGGKLRKSRVGVAKLREHTRRF